MYQQDKQNQRFFKLIYSHVAWESSIKPSLLKLSMKSYKSSQIIQKLKQFRFLSITHRTQRQQLVQQFNYRELYSQYHKQLPDIYSQIAKVILQYENQPPKFPIFYSDVQKQFTYTKKQKLLLMSMMSSNLIVDQNFKQPFKFPSYTNFQYIFTHQKYKTKTIMEYLKQEFRNLHLLGQKYNLEKLTLKRNVVNQKIQDIIHKSQDNKFKNPILASDKQSIQQYYGHTKVDFANKFIGGGALVYGCVQEEIMFANHPQLFTSVLFCQRMKQNQSIEFVGYKKYFKNTGYAQTVEFDGREQHIYQYDELNRAKQHIVAIDALHYPKKKHQLQFQMKNIDRQLLKAYSGFKSNINNKIITGNWGCGAFNGDLQLKFIIQWIAASLVQRQFVYVPFGQRNKLANQKLIKLISQVTVGQLYKTIKQNQQQLVQTKNVFKLLQSKLGNLGLL